MELLVECSGYKIFAKTEGEGYPVLMLHSYWGSLGLFDPLAQALCRDRKVIRIDFPGHGKSGDPPSEYTFDQFAGILNEILNKLQVDKMAVIGHSMGGYLAMAYAAKYPERIAALTLMHSPVDKSDIQSIKLREREARLLIKGKRALLLQAMIPSNFAPENISVMEWALNLLNQTSSQVTLAGSLSAIYAINHRKDSLDVLQQVKFPVQILIGMHDKVYRPGEQIEVAERLPNAEVLLLHHSGHMGFLEEADLVTSKIGEFLKRIT